MVVKTITITEKAYEAIKRLKMGDESFSELFMRLSAKPLRVKDLCGALKHTPEEAEAFRRRVQQIHEDLGKGLQKRIDDVRTRLQRNH